MKKRILHILASLFILAANHASGQYAVDEVHFTAYPIPELYLSENPPMLPLSIENHKNSFFHNGNYEQLALPSCGQASGIAHCLTYEFNRARNQAFDTANMMDPLFAFNFLNEGYGWYGANTMETWELIKSQGTATIADFGDPRPDHSQTENYISAWMNGYEKYYRAMHNRIEDYFYIDVSTDQGLKNLQHYLADHLTESETGGTVIFYSGTDFLYQEEAFAGTYEDSIYTQPFDYTGVYNYLGGNPTHSMTVVGYIPNNEIDFNEDGQITDDIDINFDGIVDFHDNEKTLWIIVNSYGYENYFSFLKYDAISDVWDSKVFFPIPEANYKPELTFKIKLRHYKRNAIRIRAGFAENLDATRPEKYLNLPVFNYQGGAVPMDGTYDTTENNHFLEFGIDISDGLQLLNTSGNIKLFLCIDNASDSSATLQNASAIHYQGDMETEHPLTDYQIIPATSYQELSTIIQLDGNAQNEILSILNESIHIDAFSSAYTEQIDIVGGTPPYRFEIIKGNNYIQTFDSIDIYNFSPGAWYTDSLQGYDLGFDFPLGEQFFDSVYVGGDMTLYFKSQNKPSYFRDYPYPFVSSGMYDEFQIYPMNGIPQNNPMKSQVIRTDSSFIVGVKSNTITAAGIELFPDGKVSITYHPAINSYSINGGINTSNTSYYSELPRVDRNIRKYNKVNFLPQFQQSAYTISQDGLLEIAPNTALSDTLLYLKVSDATGTETFKEVSIYFDTNPDEQLSIYPNPVLSTTQLAFESSTDQEMTLQIIATNGRVVTTQNIQAMEGYNWQQININALGLKQGIYIVRLLSDKVIMSSKMQVL